MKNNVITIANAAGIPFGIITIGCMFAAVKSVIERKYVDIGFYTFCFTASFLFAIATMKYYTLTERGIQHKFLGICYRLTPWSDLKDVMRVYYQTGARGDPPSLVFTTMRGNIYRPDESGYIPKTQRKTFYKEWLCGRIFSIGYPEKHEEQFLGFVEKYYGPLDYDYIADYEKAHPKPKEWWKE